MFAHCDSSCLSYPRAPTNAHCSPFEWILKRPPNQHAKRCASAIVLSVRICTKPLTIGFAYLPEAALHSRSTYSEFPLVSHMAVAIPCSFRSSTIPRRRRHSDYHVKTPIVPSARRCVSAPARLLPRPTLRGPQRQTINNIEPSLIHVPTDYILQSLELGGAE